MTDHRLSLGTDGDLWLVADDGADCHARCLGEPRDGLYDDLPVALWEELGRLIDEARDAAEHAEGYRLGIEATYRRQQL